MTEGRDPPRPIGTRRRRASPTAERSRRTGIETNLEHLGELIERFVNNKEK